MSGSNEELILTHLIQIAKSHFFLRLHNPNDLVYNPEQPNSPMVFRAEMALS